MKDAAEIPELTRISSKGQVVIPTDIRERMHITKGSVFGVTTEKDMIILKKIDTRLKPDDLKTLKLVEEAWKDIEEGRYKRATPDEFFKELAKWKR